FMSPTTMRALNENLRPPLTTLATRLTRTTRSASSERSPLEGYRPPPMFLDIRTPTLLREPHRPAPGFFRDTESHRGRRRRCSHRRPWLSQRSPCPPPWPASCRCPWL